MTYAVARQRLPVFRCPSDADVRPSGSTIKALIGLHTYNGNRRGHNFLAMKTETDDYSYDPSAPHLAETNYTGVAGTGTGNSSIFSIYEGIYTNRSHLSLAQISSADGTSNTLLYGETCGRHDIGRLSKDRFEITWFGVGALPTVAGLGRGSTARFFQFSSYHPNGVHFCFADGSVRVLHFNPLARYPSPEWQLLQQLAGYRDGGPIGSSD